MRRRRHPRRWARRPVAPVTGRRPKGQTGNLPRPGSATTTARPWVTTLCPPCGQPTLWPGGRVGGSANVAALLVPPAVAVVDLALLAHRLGEWVGADRRRRRPRHRHGVPALRSGAWLRLLHVRREAVTQDRHASRGRLLDSGTTPHGGNPTCSCSHPINNDDFSVFEVPPKNLPHMVKLVAGRMPDQSDPDQVLASIDLQQDNGVRVGTVIRVPFAALSQRARRAEQRQPHAVGADGRPARGGHRDLRDRVSSQHRAHRRSVHHPGLRPGDQPEDGRLVQLLRTAPPRLGRSAPNSRPRPRRSAAWR